MESLLQVLQFAHAPGVLMLLTIIRVLAALHYRSSVQSSTVLNFLSISNMHVLTVAIWQCYFANSVTSIKCFLQNWKFFTLRQQILSLFLLVPGIVCAPLFVTDGLLVFAHGLPPSIGMRVFNFIPAVLWTIPIILNSALGVFKAASGAQLRRVHQMHQVEEVFMVYLVSMILYCVFLKSSEEDTLVGSSVVTTVGILGVALVGFVFQCMYMRLHGPREHDENMGQENLAVDPSRDPQASSAVESEEHGTSAAELALPPKHPISTKHRPMTLPSYNPARVTHREDVVFRDVQVPLLRFRTVVDCFIQVAQFVHHAPSFLVLLSIIRAVVAAHHLSSVQSSTVLNFLSISTMHVLTVAIWQCYFANSLTSVKCFLQYWKFFMLRQQILSLSLSVPVIVCAPLFVTYGLLEFAHGLPPSVVMCALNFLPAILWTTPVVLYSALGLFQVARGAQLGQTHQMEDVFAVHLVNALLYCVFLKSSEGNTLVGSSDINVTTIIVFGGALVGFVFQCLYMWSQGLLEQERVTPPYHVPPRVPRLNEEMVVHSERPVSRRHIPDAVHRYSADIHRFVAALERYSSVLTRIHRC